MIGYIQRDKAKLVSQEIDLGNVKEIKAIRITSPAEVNHYPQINISIKFI